MLKSSSMSITTAVAGIAQQRQSNGLAHGFKGPRLITAGDKLGLEGRATLGRSGRRPPASAGSRRTLHPANSAFQTTSRPASGLAAQRRQTTCRFADDVNQQAQVPMLVQGKLLLLLLLLL